MKYPVIHFLLLTLIAVAQTPSLPLKPERKIEFTTREGTWLSLDFPLSKRQRRLLAAAVFNTACNADNLTKQ